MGEVVLELNTQKHSREVLSARSWDTQILSYEELLANFRKGLRNGNWGKLNFWGKALYRAALGYSKHHGSIVSGLLVVKLLALAEKLKETKGMKILKRGFKKAIEALKKYEENGVFTWAPQLKKWLRDPDYIFWLGTVQ